MKVRLRLTQLEGRDAPSHVGAPGPSDNVKNTGQHGAVVCPDLRQPGEGPNRATHILMPVQAHHGTPPPNADNGHGPTRIFDTVPNETQEC